MHATGGIRPLWGAPDLHHLVVRHTTPIDWMTSLPGVISQAITTPDGSYVTGQPIQFALIANPTKSISRRGHRSKITPLPPEEWKAWLDRKLTDAINLHTIDCAKLTAAEGKKPNMRTTHQRVMFNGTGTVKNATALEHHLTNGVGRGKAYGCGLLLAEAA